MNVKLALLSGLILSTVAFGGALAQSNTAYEHANCHASFLNNCADSGSSDAPLPLLGAGPLALAALGAALVARRRRRARSS